MKRTALRTPKVPVVWRDLEYPGPRAGVADRFDDRVGESLFDDDDEREAVEAYLQTMQRTVS